MIEMLEEIIPLEQAKLLLVRANTSFKYGDITIARGQEFIPTGGKFDDKLIKNFCDVFLILPDGREAKVK